MTGDDRLADLARAILDGTPVDWGAVDAHDDDRSGLLSELRLIEQLAEVYRRPAPASDARIVDGPARWQHLEIHECLGRGAYGAVYRAWDTRLDRDVALKILPAPRRSHERGSTIIDEGRRLARVHHPGVVTVYGAEWVGDEIGIWMELVRGETLDALLRGGRTFGTAEVVRIALHLCGAVSAVHGAGLLHGDIKAHNVIHADDGRVVLVDFGAGRERDDASVADLKGTPLYLAPEVLRGGPATVQSDVYSLGVLLYHLLTGDYPVSGQTTQEIRTAHARNARGDLRRARPDLPAALVRIVNRALDADLSRRYRSTAALAGDLVALGRRRIWYSMAAGLGLLAAGGVYRFAVRPVRREPLFSSGRTITPFEGNPQGVALSPDGSMAAFVSDHEGRPDVYVTEIGTELFHNLTRDAPRDVQNQSVRTVSFTPQGEVAFWVRTPGGPEQAGSVTNVYKAAVAPGSVPELYLADTAEFAISRDRRLVYHASLDGDPTSIRDLATGVSRPLFADPGRHVHFHIWSPDDRFIYFVRGEIANERFTTADIWRMSPDDAEPQRVTYHEAFVSYPAFVDEHTLLYLATEPDRSGPRIYAVDVEAPEARRRAPTLLTPGERFTSLAVSADGLRVAVTRATAPRSTLWIAPMTDGTVHWPSASRVPLPTGNGTSPRLAPGDLLYVGNRSADSIRKLRRVDAQDVEVWSRPGARIIGGPSVSRDGRMAFSVEQSGRTALWVAAVDGSGARIIDSPLELHGAPAWTPDGRAIITGAMLDRAPGLFRVSLDGDPPERFFEGFGLDPIVADDGGYVAFTGTDVGVEFPVLAVTMDGTPLEFGRGIRLGRGSRRLVFHGPGLLALQGETTFKNLVFIDMHRGSPRPLTDLPRDVSIRDFDVAADGSEIVMERVREQSEVVVFDLPSA